VAIVFQKTKPQQNGYIFKMVFGERLAKTINPTFMDKKRRIKKVVIEDIPFMITDDGAIVCIPKEDEVKAMAFCGSSISEDSEMYFKSNGNLKFGTIKEVYNNFKDKKVIEVLTISKKYRTGKIRWARATNVWNHGEKELIKIKTHGKEIKVTKDHSLFSAKYINSFSKIEAVEAKDLKNVVTVENLPIKKGVVASGHSDLLLTFLGLWIADGCYENKYKENYGTINIAIDEKKKHITRFLEKFCNEIQKNYGIKRSKKHGPAFRIYSTDLYKKMKLFGFEGNAKTKKVPNWIKELPNEQLKFFLKGYFSGDGSYHKRVSCSSISYKLLQDLQILLNRFGIVGIISKGQKKKPSWIGLQKIQSKNLQFKLTINRQNSINKFMDKISFIYPTNHKRDKEWMKENDISIWKKNMVKEKCGKGVVYDIEVPETECFVAEGFLCHNSGTGKTLLFHRVGEHLKLSWKDNVAIMNDISEETYKWSEKMDCHEFNEENKKLNQQPTPLPMVYIYPHTNTLKIAEEIKKLNHVKITIPFSEITNEIGFYIQGVNPDFRMEKSGMYVNELNEELSICDSQRQVINVLKEGLPGGDGKSFEAMRTKILTAFNTLFKEEIFDITTIECPSSLQIYEEGKTIFESNPFSVLMKAGHIPSFVTSDLSTKKYQSTVISYFVNSIFQNNLKDFPNERTWLCFDELADLCKSNSEPASQAIGRVSAMGRINNIGLLYATQFYDKIPHSIRGAKLNYLFCFQHHNNKIISEIGGDFDLDRTTRSKIKNLSQFECIAMTKDRFVFYKDNERWEDSKPVVGYILFPLSNHKKVGERR